MPGAARAHAGRRRSGRRLILATCHRRENQGERVRAVCEALKRMVAELPVRIVVAAPSQPPRPPGDRAGRSPGPTAIELTEPLDYEAMVRLMDESWLILTDSGGLQEEAPALGRPLLVLRNVTERPEALATGNIELVGTDPDRIVAAVAGLLADDERNMPEWRGRPSRSATATRRSGSPRRSRNGWRSEGLNALPTFETGRRLARSLLRMSGGECSHRHPE